jgi:hypothetical protein
MTATAADMSDAGPTLAPAIFERRSVRPETFKALYSFDSTTADCIPSVYFGEALPVARFSLWTVADAHASHADIGAGNRGIPLSTP